MVKVLEDRLSFRFLRSENGCWMVKVEGCLRFRPDPDEDPEKYEAQAKRLIQERMPPNVRVAAIGLAEAKDGVIEAFVEEVLLEEGGIKQ